MRWPWEHDDKANPPAAPSYPLGGIFKSGAIISTAISEPSSTPQPAAALAVEPIPEALMNIFSSVITGLTNAEKFLLNLFTKANSYAAIFQKLSPTMIGAIVAVFYDVIKTVSSTESVAATAASGNIPGAVTLSATTLSLVEQVWADAKAGEASVVTAFKALNLPAPVVTTAATGISA